MHEWKTAVKAEPETFLLFNSSKKYRKVFSAPHTMCSPSEVARGHSRNLRCCEVINEVGTVVQWLAVLPHSNRVLVLIPGMGLVCVEFTCSLTVFLLHKKGQLILKVKFPRVLLSYIIFLLSFIIIPSYIIINMRRTTRTTKGVCSALWSVPQRPVGSLDEWLNP